MSQTESTAKRGNGDGNREGDAGTVDLAGSFDARVTADPTYVPEGWIVHGSDDGDVRGCSKTVLHAGDDHRRRATEHRRRADR